MSHPPDASIVPPLVRVAQVGCHGVAHNHARAHQLTGNTSLDYVCDIDAERAAGFAAQHNVPCHTTSFDQLLADEGVDLIDLVTPDHTHADLAIRAIEAGKHVLVEKPLATTLADADRVIAAAKRMGVKVMCVQSLRWLPKFRAAWNQIQAGVIGKPVFIRMWGGCSPFWSPDNWPKAASGGRADYNLLHNGMHSMDMVAWIVDQLPVSVHTLGHPGQEGVPLWEYFTVNLRFAGGALGCFEENRIIQPPNYPTPGLGLYVVGQTGTLSLEATGNLSVSMYNRDGWHHPGSHVAMAPGRDNFADMIRHLAGCIIDDAEPEVSLAHSRGVLAAVLAAAESFNTGRPVEVSYE